MALKQIKEFTAQTSPASGDLLLIQEASGDAYKKTTIAQAVNPGVNAMVSGVSTVGGSMSGDAETLRVALNALINALKA